jgi:nucleotide-binding universal stress UspA family protein
MNILVPTDGSPFTLKALDFVADHPELLGDKGELVVVHVQPMLPPGVKGFVGSATVASYHEEEAAKVLKPTEEHLRQRGVHFRSLWLVGNPAGEILETVKAQKIDLIVMGTHGMGLLRRAMMGSVAQRVVAECETPVLLVK